MGSVPNLREKGCCSIMLLFDSLVDAELAPVETVTQVLDIERAEHQETSQSSAEHDRISHDEVVAPSSSEDIISDKAQVAGPSTALTPPTTDHTDDVTSAAVVGPLVPSPFKRTLFWHGGTAAIKKKRPRKEKLPAVVTSPQML